MALRGSLTKNIDKRDSAEATDHSYERFENREPTRESFQESFYEEKATACPKCGRMLPENSRFCNYCGASLAVAEPEVNRDRRESSAGDSIAPPASVSSSTMHSRTDTNYPGAASSCTDVNYPEAERRRVGVNDLGAFRSRYGCAYGILIEDILCIALGAYAIAMGMIIAQDDYVRFAAFFGYDPYGWIIPFGLIIVVVGMIDFFIRKDNRLEVYEDGIRGKGSTGWLGYRMKPFQFRFDEIIRVENKAFMFPGIYISAGSGEISEIRLFIRHSKKAVEEINSLLAKT